MSATESGADSTAHIRRSDYWSISLARVLGACCLFAYHFINDLRLRDGLAYEITGPIGFLGYFGVGVFVVVSGIVLGRPWERDGSYGAFLRRRLVSLFSLYWWIAVPLMALGLLVGMMPTSDLWKAPFWLLGLNSLGPELFRPLVSAWWYMGLALQIVLVYPLVHATVRRLGAVGSLAVAALTVAVSVGLIALLPSPWGYLRDGFVGARMLELTFGAVIGESLRQSRALSRLAAPAALYAGLAVLAAGILPDMPLRLLSGLGAAALVSGLLVVEHSSIHQLAPRPLRALTVLGGLSFAFYLVHPPIVRVAIGALEPVVGLGVLPVAFGVSLIAAWGFNASHSRLRTPWRPARPR